MYGKLIAPEIEELIAGRDFSTIKEVFAEWSAVDLAELVSDLREESRVIVFGLLPVELASDTFSYCDFDTQQGLLHDMARENVSALLNDMSPDDRTQLFEDLPANFVAELISSLNAEERSVALGLLNWPEDSIGRLMTPDYVVVKKHWNIQQALQHIRQYGKDSETLNYVYVTEHGTLIDDIHIREILLANSDAVISDLMDYKAESLVATADQETAVQAFRKLDRFALPVVDADNKLLGIVTLDDVLDVAEEQATEEMQMFGAVEVLEGAYIDTPILELVRTRATWLIVLFFGGIITAASLTYFEDMIDKAVILAILLPMIISNGGNSGSQSATLIVRALALGEVTLFDWWKIMRREVIVGILLGLMLGILGIIRIVVWAQLDGSFSPATWLVATVVFISLVFIVVAGTIAGSMLPLLMKRLGFDPAASSAPFVATFSDVTGTLIYFTIASLLLSGVIL
ncbi:MAG: magnesium transporter [Ignavibacteria bacterium]|nr:magnesium transporter [Ignavibacteria bacterium]